MLKTWRLLFPLLAAFMVGLGLLYQRSYHPVDAVPSPVLSAQRPTEETPVSSVISTDSAATNPTLPVAPRVTSLLSSILVRATLLSEISEPTAPGQIRRSRVWDTEGTQRYVRTEETIVFDDEGNASVRSRVAMVADHLLVQLVSATVDTRTLDILNAAGLELFEQVTPDGLYRAKLTGFEDPDQIPAAIRASSGAGGLVLFAEPDYLVFASKVPTDPLFRDQWALHSREDHYDVDAPLAWDIATDASAVLVGILDSGIRASHADLKAALWNNPLEIAGNGIDDDRNGYVDDLHGVNFVNGTGDPTDDNGHGSHVAGIIGASSDNGIGVSGLAWRSRMMALKTLDRDGIGTVSDAIQAIDYALAHGVSVLNASWGSNGRSDALEQAIQRASNAGAIFVAAAGNEGRNIDVSPIYPASYRTPNLVAVAATTRFGGLASFSNWGPQSVMLAAPGVSILSTYNLDDGSYVTESGTSMAAPVVTGIVALLRASEPSLDSDAIIIRLARTGRWSLQLADKTTLESVVNAGSALRNLQQIEPHDAFREAGQLVGYRVKRILFPGLATSEFGEPLHGPFREQGTIWLTWSTAVRARVTLRIGSPLSAASVHVYTGASLQDLTRQASGSRSRVASFVAEPGDLYRIVVAADSTTRPVRVDFELSARPLNDGFNLAEILLGGFHFVQGTTENASPEAFEPTAGGRGNTVWWAWTPERSGPYVVATGTGDSTTVFRLYRRNGSGIRGLVAVKPIGESPTGRRAAAFLLEGGRTYHIQVDSLGIFGNRFTLNLEPARNPFIANQPRDTQLRPDQTLTLGVTALGTPPLTYQWELNNTPIPGEEGPSLVRRNVRREDTGDYRVKVASPTGATVSRLAVVNLLPADLRILKEPKDLSVRPGGAAGFAVLATGDGELSYQWFKNDATIAGAVSSNLGFAVVSQTDAGTYHVEVSSPFGRIKSSDARLTLSSEDTPEWVQRLPSTPTTNFNAGIHADGLFVLGGQAGIYATSSDGVTWQYHRLPEVFNIDYIGRIGGNWVFVGYSRERQGTYSFVSRDLITWNAHRVADQPLSGFAASGQRAVAIGESVRISDDGIIWRTPTGIPKWLSQVAWANNRFLAFQGSDVGGYTSADGEGWTRGADKETHDRGFQSDGDWFYGGSERSRDGVTWGPVPIFNFHASSGLISGGLMVVRRDSELQVTSDGEHFSSVSAPLPIARYPTVNVFIRDGAQWVMAGNGGAIASGSARESFVYRAFPAPATRLVEAGGVFFALGNPSFFSADGLEWTHLPHPERGRKSWGKVFSLNGQFFLIDTSSGAYTGPTLLNLQPTTADFWGAHGGDFGHVYRLSNLGDLMRSSDGVTWTKAMSDKGANSIQTGIRAGDFLYLVCWRGTYVVPRTGSITYISQFDRVTGIATSGSLFGAVANGYLYRSVDGLSWTQTDPPTPNERPFAIAHGEGRFLVATDRANLYESFDLQSWNRIGTIDGYDGNLIHSKGRFWLTVHSATKEGEYWGGSGQGIQSLGEPTRLVPVVGFEGLKGGSITLPLFSQETLFPIASDPDGNLSEISVTASGPASWLTELPGGAWRYAPTASGKHVVTVRAVDRDGNVTTELLPFEMVATAPAPELPQGYLGRMNAAVSFRGSWWAFGSGGFAVRSDDGVRWEGFRLASGMNLMDVRVIADRLVGATMDDRLVTSEDGLNWTDLRPSTASSQMGFPKLFPAGNRLYYRETGTRVLTSVNGFDWETTAGLPKPKSVVHEVGGIIFETESAGHRFSVDGIHFSDLSGYLPTGTGSIVSVAAGGGRLAAVDVGGKVFMATDPTAGWNHVFTVAISIGETASLRYMGGRFYAGTVHREFSIPAHASTDGELWEPCEVPPVKEVIARSGRLIAVGTEQLTTSLDGLIWEEDPGKPGIPADCIVLQGDQGVLAMRKGTASQIWRDGGRSVFSKDGLDWPRLARTPFYSDSRIAAIASCDSRRFLTETRGYPGGVSKIMVSRGHGPWGDLVLGTQVACELAAGVDRVLAMTPGGAIWSSSNPGDWSRMGNLPGSVSWSDTLMAFEGDRFLVSTRTGDLLYSDTGSDWQFTDVPGRDEDRIEGIAFGAGRWIVTKGTGIHSSYDLNRWMTESGLNASGPARFIGSKFYLPTIGGCYVSGNGLSWSYRLVDARRGYFRVARVAGRVVLFRTSPGPTDLISSGYYDFLETGFTEFSGSPYVYDAMDAGHETYMLGKAGTMQRIARLDLRIESVSTGTGAVAPGVDVPLEITVSNPTTETIPAGLEIAIDVHLKPRSESGDEPAIRLERFHRVFNAPVPPGRRVTFRADTPLPDVIPPGAYWFSARMTTNQLEASLLNNQLIEKSRLIQLAARTLTTNVSGPGSVLGISAGSMRVAEGSRIHLVPIAGPDAAFVRWEGTEGGIGAVTLRMTENREVTAFFAGYHSVRLATFGGGAVSADQDLDSLAPGSTVLLDAKAAPGWFFSGWSGDASGNATSLELPTDRNRSVQANFDRTRDSFLAAHFTADERDDPNLIGDLADPDGDGLVNVVEFIFDLDPRHADSFPPIIVGHSGDEAYVIFPRNRFLDGWSVQVVSSIDLINWSTDGLVEHLIDSDGTHDFIEVRRTAGARESVFFRLEMTAPDARETAAAP